MKRAVNMALDFFKESNRTVEQSKAANAREKKNDKHTHNEYWF